MAAFELVKMRSLDYHYRKELLPIVKSHFRHVTKPFVDIPGFRDTYLTWRDYFRRLRGEENKPIHTMIRDEYVKKYSDPNTSKTKYNFPDDILESLTEYSISRFFLQIPELRPRPMTEEWARETTAEEIVRPIQVHKELLLNKFAEELERKKVIARDRSSKVLRSYDIAPSKSSNPFKSHRPSMKISEFLVGKNKRTQKKGKGKRRRRSRTGKRRR